jgi:hypothetical protein
VLGCLATVVLAAAIAAGAAALIVGVGWWQYGAEMEAENAAASNPKYARPLASTAGRLVFVVGRLGTDDLYAVDADGSDLTRLTELPDRTVMFDPPVWSPDGARIAFVAEGLYVLRPDSRETPQLVHRYGHSPVWLEGGRSLAFLGPAHDAYHVYIADLEGSAPARNVAAGWPAPRGGYSHSTQSLALSRDAGWLAFARTTRHRWKGRQDTLIHVARRDGAAFALTDFALQPLPEVWGGLSWSPDGERLVLTGGTQIATVNRDGSGFTAFDMGEFALPYRQLPQWSPEGDRLLWYGPRGIVTSNADGGAREELTFGRGGGIHPAWSPDGGRIAFICDYSTARVCVMNADGSGLTELAHLSKGQSFLDRGTTAKLVAWRPQDRP